MRRKFPALVGTESRTWPRAGYTFFKHDSELGNAHSHALFDRLAVVSNDPTTPARDISAYAVTFDGAPVTIGQEIQAAPGVTLTRRC